MLSKKAARAFFLAGTAVCTLVFVGLTVDTFGRIPAQTRASQITPAVRRGKDLWDHNNCMGCHTLLGEGAYYAPELTRVYRRRGEDFIRAMLRDPEAMYPGQRRMQNYHFSAAQIDDLVAFLRWIDGMDLNGFPAAPNLASASPASATAAAAVNGRRCSTSSASRVTRSAAAAARSAPRSTASATASRPTTSSGGCATRRASSPAR